MEPRRRRANRPSFVASPVPWAPLHDQRTGQGVPMNHVASLRASHDSSSNHLAPFPMSRVRVWPAPQSQLLRMERSFSAFSHL